MRIGFWGKEYTEAGVYKDEKKAKKRASELELLDHEVEMSWQVSGPDYDPKKREHVIWARKRRLGGLL